ncbi:PXA domain-containing protein [Jimgerdemannia flammicorona]|uniref:PXA domain-containing protein n=1 Tax=Jimgerdemannia flammicorona TaxID=994334 RepID=A0A433QUJ1_9FUNG|nr:PXA domain-containing protein [Jimgerdemannia flammicorona]
MPAFFEHLPVPSEDPKSPTSPLNLTTLLSAPFLVLFLILLALDGHYIITSIILGFVAGAVLVIGFVFGGHLGGNGVVDKLSKRIGAYHDLTMPLNENIPPPENPNSSKAAPLFRTAFKALQLSTSDLTSATEHLFDLFTRDYVLSWWTNMNHLDDAEFQAQVRVSMNAVIMNLEACLLRHQRNDLVLVAMYAVANSLIIHMRENRALEASTIPIPDYIRSNPQSPFAQYLPRSAQYTYFRELSTLVLKRLLPADDATSPVLTVLLRELFASHLFESTIEMCSDPDWINLRIVEYLSSEKGKEKGEKVTGDEELMSGFVDMVEMAAEELIENESAGKRRYEERVCEQIPAQRQASVHEQAAQKQAMGSEQPARQASGREPTARQDTAWESTAKQSPVTSSPTAYVSAPLPTPSSQPQLQPFASESTSTTPPPSPTPTPTPPPSTHRFRSSPAPSVSTSSPAVRTPTDVVDITTTPPTPASPHPRPFDVVSTRPLPSKSLSASSAAQPSMQSFHQSVAAGAEDQGDDLEVKSRRRGYDDDEGSVRPRGGSDASISRRNTTTIADGPRTPNGHRRTFSDEVPTHSSENRNPAQPPPSTAHLSAFPTPSPTSSYTYSFRPKPAVVLPSTTPPPPPQRPSLIYPLGTIHFHLTDISPPPTSGGPGAPPPPKQSLLYMIQIERPVSANVPSDGGGYVITRTYVDFENIHATLANRYPRRMTKLRLPLDKSSGWRRSSAARAAAFDGDEVVRQLQAYLVALVEDQEVGRDETVAWFLRKEASAAEEAGIAGAAPRGERKRAFAVTGVASRAMSLLTRGAANGYANGHTSGNTNGNASNGSALLDDGVEEWSNGAATNLDEGRRRPFSYAGEDPARTSTQTTRERPISYAQPSSSFAPESPPQGMGMMMGAGLIAAPQAAVAKMWGRGEDGVYRERMRREREQAQAQVQAQKGMVGNGGVIENGRTAENSSRAAENERASESNNRASESNNRASESNRSSLRSFAALIGGNMGDESVPRLRARENAENAESSSNAGAGIGEEREGGKWWNLGGILTSSESDEEASGSDQRRRTAPVRTEGGGSSNVNANGLSKWSVGGLISAMMEDSDDDSSSRDGSSSRRSSSSTAASSIIGPVASSPALAAVLAQEGQVRKRRMTSPLAEQVLPDEAEAGVDDDLNANGIPNTIKTKQGSVYRLGGIGQMAGRSTSSLASAGSSAESSSPVEFPFMSSTMQIPQPLPQLDPLPANRSPSPPQQQRTTPTSRPLSAMDIDLLIETAFALIEETFHLNDRAWLRRTALNLLKEMLRRSYTDTISKTFLHYLDRLTSVDAVVTYVQGITEATWPEGPTRPVRTREEKERTKWLAREMLIEKGVPTAVRQVVGEQNCVEAMERLWERCQRKELNRVLVVQVVEVVVRTAIG